jgi:hypothetical protein
VNEACLIGATRILVIETCVCEEPILPMSYLTKSLRMGGGGGEMGEESFWGKRGQRLNHGGV